MPEFYEESSKAGMRYQMRPFLLSCLPYFKRDLGVAIRLFVVRGGTPWLLVMGFRGGPDHWLGGHTMDFEESNHGWERNWGTSENR
jgi:hypothetical protein